MTRRRPDYGPPNPLAWQLYLLCLIALVFLAWVVTAVWSSEAFSQETCTPDGACLIPPITIERADPVIFAPEFTG